MKYGIVVFPGSNCDHDAYHAAKLSGAERQFLWHKDTSIPKDIDCVILPGGFAFGDYLRCGAIARFSPIMREVIEFANRGGYVIGICNGFQVLTEAGLLPGALLRNNTQHFRCKDVFLNTNNNNTAFTSAIPVGKNIRVPIAHGEGSYFAEPDVIEMLENTGRVVFRYCDSNGNVTPESNPNGSINNIAGITNDRGNVMGMMPHPERASDELLGNTDGMLVFRSIAGIF